MNNYRAIWIPAILVLTLFVGAVYTSQKQLDLINECEKSLPRDVHCHLTAVPDNNR
jgi:hypothetical protein